MSARPVVSAIALRRKMRCSCGETWIIPADPYPSGPHVTRQAGPALHRGEAGRHHHCARGADQVVAGRRRDHLHGAGVLPRSALLRTVGGLSMNEVSVFEAIEIAWRRKLLIVGL